MTLANSFSAYQTRIKDLQNQIDKMNIDHSAKDREIDELNSEIDNMKKLHNELNKSYTDLLQKNTSLYDDNQRLVSTNSALNVCIYNFFFIVVNIILYLAR